MLFAMGAAAKWSELARDLACRRLVTAVLALFGVYTMVSPHSHGPHGHMTAGQEKVTGLLSAICPWRNSENGIAKVPHIGYDKC